MENICTNEWNSQMDGGKPFRQGVAELSAQYPEYAKDIEVYFTRWIEMMGEEIDGMVVSAEEHCIKPSPRIYQILLERFGFNACDCVFIDDRQPNVNAAKSVGMTGILFTGVQHLKAKLEMIL